MAGEVPGDAKQRTISAENEDDVHRSWKRLCGPTQGSFANGRCGVLVQDDRRPSRGQETNKPRRYLICGLFITVCNNADAFLQASTPFTFVETIASPQRYRWRAKAGANASGDDGNVTDNRWQSPLHQSFPHPDTHTPQATRRPCKV